MSLYQSGWARLWFSNKCLRVLRQQSLFAYATWRLQVITGALLIRSLREAPPWHLLPWLLGLGPESIGNHALALNPHITSVPISLAKTSREARGGVIPPCAQNKVTKHLWTTLMTIRTASVKLLVGLDKAKAPIWNEGIQEPLTGQTTLDDITKVCPCCA